MWLDITSSNNKAHMEAIVSRTRGRDGGIIKTMDGEIIKIICHHPSEQIAIGKEGRFGRSTSLDARFSYDLYE